MLSRLPYSTTAKVFHWLTVALMTVEYLIGWLMPAIHRGQQPGQSMTLHLSFGILIRVLTATRLLAKLIAEM
jgi:cytochrome b561